jgi:predicted chitinase
MTTINSSQIQKLAPNMANSYRATFTADDIAVILTRYGISKNPLRVCHFLAQALVESGRMQEMIEDLNYSVARLMAVWPNRFPNAASAEPYAHNPEKLGNFVYGGRMGNTQDGDGYKFRGRGLLQITGRGAYTKYGSQLGVPLAGNPDLAFDPAYCLEIAAAEWAASGYHGQFCNDLADLDDVYGVTRAINGGLTDIDARIAALKQCKAIWLAGAPLEAPAFASAALARGAEPAELTGADEAIHPYYKRAVQSPARAKAKAAPTEAASARAGIVKPYFKRPEAKMGPRAAAPGQIPTPWNIGDLCAAYQWPTGLSGGGVIGIVELDGGWTPSDMQMFFNQISQPLPAINDIPVEDGASNNPNQHLNDPDHDPDIEVTMDIQVAAAAYFVATGKAAVINVYWANNRPGGIAAAVRRATQDGCAVCSISWGADEAIWQQWSDADHDYIADMEAAANDANTAGMVVFAASGDNDSSDGGDNPADVDVPSSCPSVVGCGGTTKFRNSEIVWNDSPGQSNGNGTGGGFSRYFPRPAWQALAPADNDGDATRRMIPDVAANADPYTGYNLAIHGALNHWGGTSAVAPLYAGLFAAFGQKLG